MNLFELTRNLIDIPSVTGNEKAIGEFLAAHLGSLGYTVQMQEVERDRFNVIAVTEERPRVVFSTHMDTVPPEIFSSEDEARIYGRGSCDAKGIIAAQIMAAEELRAGGAKEIGLLFTVDEEMGSRGAQFANLNKPEHPSQFLINGEPTDNNLATATKGSLRLTIKTFGRSSHSAYPEYGESAIEKLLDVLADIRKCAWPTHSSLGQTTCNIGVVHGGTRPNVIPSEASAELQLRLVGKARPVKLILEAAVNGRAEIQYSSEHEPIHLMPVAGFARSVVRFTTDIPYLTNWGTPLLLGPGSILNAHTEHEFIEKRELSEAVDLYVRLARTLFAREDKHRLSETAEGAVQ
ncbi:MAG: M20/M25/M40 family metallo-hydrolase [Pyrinomonadaceae bacterium]